MLDWLGHQWKVWRYGARVLIVLAIAAAVSLLAGGIVLELASWPLGHETSLTEWLLAGLAVSPFALVPAAQIIADHVRTDPPPSDIGLLRKRLGMRD